MTKRKLSNPLKLIKSIITYRKRQKIYVAHLEAAFCALRMREETRNQFTRN